MAPLGLFALRAVVLLVRRKPVTITIETARDVWSNILSVPAFALGSWWLVTGVLWRSTDRRREEILAAWRDGRPPSVRPSWQASSGMRCVSPVLSALWFTVLREPWRLRLFS